MADHDLETKSLGFGLDLDRQFRDVVNLLELVQDPVFTRQGRVEERKRQALHRVAQGQESAPLMTFAVEGQRMPDDRLATEPIDDSAESLIEIETGPKAFITKHLIDVRTEHDALHDISRTDTPKLASEHNIVGTMDLGPVIPGTRLTRERQSIASPSILDLKEALGNVDVRCTILTHCS